MKKQDKKVTLKVVNETGHTTLQLSPQEALNRVKTETQENGKWCYVDGNFKSFDTLTETDLASANEVVLVSALLGGS